MSVELIKEQAYQTNDLITAYILLHNKIIKDTSSFKSLFRKVNFEEPYLQAKGMLTQWQKKKDELHDLKKKLSKNLSKDERKFLEQLIRVAEKVFRAAEYLAKRQHLHYRKSLGDTSNWKNFARIQKEYQQAIERYTKEKEKLNSMTHLLR